MIRSTMAQKIAWRHTPKAACSLVSGGAQAPHPHNLNSTMASQSALLPSTFRPSYRCYFTRIHDRRASTSSYHVADEHAKGSKSGIMSNYCRYFSSSGVVIGADPVLDSQGLQQSISDLAPAMAQGLGTVGYWTITGDAILPMDMIVLIRKQAFELRRQGRYEQSWSERVVGGLFKERFDKEGVFACEPDGHDYDTAPDLILYMTVLLQTLPNALNQAMGAVAPQLPNPDLSNSSFNAKLAVTLPGGSTYPLHVDNPQGLQVNDTRKLTCILYLNPDYDEERGDGGELRLVVGKQGIVGDETTQIDFTPEGGRMVMFWSDEIPHEVLPTAPDYDGSIGDELVDNPLDRYALTLWIPTEDISTIHNESSTFRLLRELAFPAA